MGSIETPVQRKTAELLLQCLFMRGANVVGLVSESDGAPLGLLVYTETDLLNLITICKTCGPLPELLAAFDADLRSNGRQLVILPEALPAPMDQATKEKLKELGFTSATRERTVFFDREPQWRWTWKCISEHCEAKHPPKQEGYEEAHCSMCQETFPSGSPGDQCDLCNESELVARCVHCAPGCPKCDVRPMPIRTQKRRIK